MGKLFLPPPKNFGEHQHQQQDGTAPLHCSDSKTGHCFIQFKLVTLIQGECGVGLKYTEVIDAKPYHKVVPGFHFSTDDSKTGRTRL